MSKHICKRLTLAQCVYVQCRPTVERCRPLHSAYLHTPLMCIASWQSGAHALKRSALYMMTQNSGTVSDSFYLAALIESYSYSSSLVWEQYELRARANRAQECMLQQTGGKNRFF